MIERHVVWEGKETERSDVDTERSDVDDRVVRCGCGKNKLWRVLLWVSHCGCHIVASGCGRGVIVDEVSVFAYTLPRPRREGDVVVRK